MSKLLNIKYLIIIYIFILYANCSDIKKYKEIKISECKIEILSEYELTEQNGKYEYSFVITKFVKNKPILKYLKIIKNTSYSKDDFFKKFDKKYQQHNIDNNSMFDIYKFKYLNYQNNFILFGEKSQIMIINANKSEIKHIVKYCKNHIN